VLLKLLLSVNNDLTRQLFNQRVLFILCLAVCLIGKLHSNETLRITLVSGEVLLGQKRVVESSEAITLEHSVFGTLEIPKESVAQIETIPVPVSVQAESKLTEKALPEAVVMSTEVSPQQEQQQKQKQETPKNERLDLLKEINKLKAPKSWAGNLKLGMNYSMGDRKYEQTYLRGKVRMQKERSPHSLEFKGEYIYQETERSTGDIYVSADRFYTDFTYRWQYSEHWFLQNLTTLRKDTIKGIEREIQNLSGVGYRTKLSEKLELLVGSGIGFQDKSLDSAIVSDQKDWVVNVFQELNWTPLERMKISEKVNYFRNPNEIAIYNYDFTLSLNYRLTDLLGLEMRYIKDFDNGIDDKFGEDSRFQNALTLYF
jgi:hypothetical protein